MRHLWLIALAGCASGGYSRSSLERHIVFLASDEMKGRDNDTPEGLKAGQYVVDQLQAIGLKPAGVDGTWFHEFEGKGFTGKPVRGRNVAGLLPGRDLAHEFVVVSAHYDARGVVGGKVQNGADDNASGVAAVIELARAFARTPCRRSLVFIGFDAEEDGLIGSREYVKAKVQDPKDVAAMFVFDCFGGNFTPWEDRRVYALGSEYSPEMWDRVGRACAGERGLDVQRLGVYIIEALYPRSDYDAYRRARVPFVFLTTATPWFYHTEHDDPDIINYAKLTRGVAFAERLIRGTADDEKRPEFAAKPSPDYSADARRLKEGAERMLKEGRLSDTQREGLRKSIGDLDGIIESPSAEAVPKMQRVMVQFFGVVASQRPK